MKNEEEEEEEEMSENITKNGYFLQIECCSKSVVYSIRMAIKPQTKLYEVGYAKVIQIQLNQTSIFLFVLIMFAVFFIRLIPFWVNHSLITNQCFFFS